MRANHRRILGDFADRAKSAPNIDALQSLFHGVGADLGIRYWAYHMVSAPIAGDGTVKAITTYPEEWVRHYIERKLVHSDPVVLRATKKPLSFRWSDVIRPEKLPRDQLRMMKDAGEAGIRDGYTVPITEPLAFAMMTAVPDGAEKEGADFLSGCAQLMQALALNFHEAADRLDPLNQGGVVLMALTGRERECLAWTSAGKSTWDISQILGIAERTVVFHLEKAKEKLGVSNRTHAVVKAFTLGLIEDPV